MKFQEIADELRTKAEKYKKSQYLYEQDWGHGIEIALTKLNQADDLPTNERRNRNDQMAPISKGPAKEAR